MLANARKDLACENIRFSLSSSLGTFRAEEKTSPAEKSEEKRMFSQASKDHSSPLVMCANTLCFFYSLNNRGWD